MSSKPADTPYIITEAYFIASLTATSAIRIASEALRHNRYIRSLNNPVGLSSPVEPTSSEAQDRYTDGNATSQKKRSDITEITDNEVIHGDVIIAQTPATARLTQSCKLISSIATHAPAPPSSPSATSSKEKAKHKKYSNISYINNPSIAIG
jgi:hypothetical protein